jgi:hypothetical protein
MKMKKRKPRSGRVYRLIQPQPQPSCTPERPSRGHHPGARGKAGLIDGPGEPDRQGCHDEAPTIPEARMCPSTFECCACRCIQASGVAMISDPGMEIVRTRRGRCGELTAARRRRAGRVSSGRGRTELLISDRPEPQSPQAHLARSSRGSSTTGGSARPGPHRGPAGLRGRGIGSALARCPGGRRARAATIRIRAPRPRSSSATSLRPEARVGSPTATPDDPRQVGTAAAAPAGRQASGRRRRVASTSTPKPRHRAGRDRRGEDRPGEVAPPPTEVAARNVPAAMRSRPAGRSRRPRPGAANLTPHPRPTIRGGSRPELFPSGDQVPGGRRHDRGTGHDEAPAASWRPARRTVRQPRPRRCQEGP